MSQVLNINGVEFVSAGQAGKQFGYTRDYILTLAREGKIDGQKIGNRWYVNPSSAKSFFEHAEVEREERRRTISLERKAELRQYIEVDTGVRKHVALAETCAVLVLGLSVGMLGYLGVDRGGALSAVASQSASPVSFFEELALSFYEFLSPSRTEVTTVAVTPAYTDIGKQTVEEVEGVSNIKTDSVDPSSFVVFPQGSLGTSGVAQIKSLFSDEVIVTVDPENPDTGMIVPQFKDGAGDAYRFLIVPTPSVAGG